MLITLYVHATPPWHVCPIVGNLFNPVTHAESGYIADTGLQLITYMNMASWHNMRKWISPFTTLIWSFSFQLNSYMPLSVVGFLPPRVNLEMPLLSPCCLRTHEFLISKFDYIFSIHYVHSAHAMVHISAPRLNTKTPWLWLCS